MDAGSCAIFVKVVIRGQYIKVKLIFMPNGENKFPKVPGGPEAPLILKEIKENLTCQARMRTRKRRIFASKNAIIKSGT